MYVKFAEFKKGLTEGKRFATYLFEGEDVFFRERGLLALKSLLENPELNFAVLDGDSTENQILSSVSAYPFMSDIRITCIREFYPKADQLKGALGQFIKNDFDGSALVILNSKSTDQLKKIDNVLVVDCNKADVLTIVKWITAETKRNQVDIDGETARLIAEFCSLDMTRIETETNKLISSATAGGVITAEMVKDLVARDTEYKIYELTDFIAKKKIDDALMVIQDMLSKGETMQRIIVYVYNYFRRLLHAAISGKTALELADLLGVKEFAAKKLMLQANSFKKKNLKNAVDFLTDADYKIKSGQGDPESHPWAVLFKIMTQNT